MRITNILFQLGNYSDHHKEIHQTGKYILHIEAKGYDPKMVMVDIPKMYKNKVQKELNPVYLRKKPKKLEVMLDEVVVTATKSCTSWTLPSLIANSSIKRHSQLYKDRLIVYNGLRFAESSPNPRKQQMSIIISFFCEKATVGLDD